MRFYKQVSIAAFILLNVMHARADVLEVKLNTQIELLPSCVINDQQYLDGAKGLNLGMLNFGKFPASYNGILEASLSSGLRNSINIRCNGTLNGISIIFGAGKNDSNVPDSVKDTYFRALSNGSYYIAYNLIYGLSKQVLKPQDKLPFQNKNEIVNIDLYGKATLSDPAISTGIYTDVIPVVIEF